MSAEPNPTPPVPPLHSAVLKGCLLGVALAASWAVFGLLIYALLAALGASLGLRVLLAGLGGPLVGSALVIAWWLRRYAQTGSAALPRQHAPGGDEER